MGVPLNEYVPIWHAGGTLLFAPNGGKVSPLPPQLVKGTFMGMVYLREELFGGLSQAYNGGVCVVAVFVAFYQVLATKVATLRRC